VDESTEWMTALASLRTQGWTYERIGEAVGASARSVRRWELRRLAVEAGHAPTATTRREAAPLPVYIDALLRLSAENRRAG